MSDDTPQLKVTERAVLKKFAGEVTEEQAETTEPEEVLVIQDGELIDHWRKGDGRPVPE